MSSYYIMAVLLAPCGWIRRKGSGRRRARLLFFTIKNNLILAARGKHSHNTKDIAPPEINTAAGVLVTGHFSFGRPAALFARENGPLC